MSLLELFLIGVSLSMDAFAVAVCRGLAMRRIYWGQALTVGLYFGGFQALMPFLGWVLGSAFAGYIQSVDHWVAFVLLLLIGGNMLRENLTEQEEPDCGPERDGRKRPIDHKEMLLMAVATSIDALAVGITFAFLNVAIVPAVTVIGMTTFCISVAGVAVGNFFGARYKRRAGITGGVILMLLGTKILLEHLGIL